MNRNTLFSTEYVQVILAVALIVASISLTLNFYNLYRIQQVESLHSTSTRWSMSDMKQALSQQELKIRELELEIVKLDARVNTLASMTAQPQAQGSP